MNQILTIELKGLRFYAHHGLYPEEKKTGNEFEVNLFVTYHPQQGEITAISETINYATLYELVRDEMNRPAGLLETVAMKIAAAVKMVFPQTQSIRIGITKLHPPIAGFTGHVGVNYEKVY